MARRPAAFTQADVVRAVKAGRAAGLDVAGFELSLENRTIRIVERSEKIAHSPFDQWKAKSDARQTQRA